MSDITSEAAWRNKRRLPVVPNEEPVTAGLVRRHLVRERFSKQSTSPSRPLLRPSSSLDSATEHYRSVSPVHRATSGLGGRLSPYSSLSDIVNMINSAAGMGRSNSPTYAIATPGKSSTGLLIDQLNRSPSRGQTIAGIGRDSTHSGSPTPPILPGYMKTIKQQLKDELRTVVEERRRLLDLRDHDKDFYRRSESDLNALFDLYSSVPDVVLPTTERPGHRRTRRYNSDPRLVQYSPINEEIPPGYFKSYELETLRRSPGAGRHSPRRSPRRPTSSMAGDDSVRVTGMSQLATLQNYLSDLDGNLRESQISHQLDSNDNDLFLTSEFDRKYRRRSEGSVDLNVSADRLMYTTDPYGREVPYGQPLQGRLVRGTAKGQRSMRSSPHMFDIGSDRDVLTREEKAANVRAEIARRRQMLNESVAGAQYAEDELLAQKFGQYGVDPRVAEYYGHPQGRPEQFELDYEQDDPNLAFVDPRHLHAQGMFSRSFDGGYDDYYEPGYDDRGGEGDEYYEPNCGYGQG